ncbi:MAG TPA: hypothetical protein VMA31_00270 [Bryobacteraceae bacterium]|nr:hypothetical protein [Bryobacteraceae bacterium]
MICSSHRLVLLAASLSFLPAQTLVVNRVPADRSPIPQPVSRGSKGSYADAFRIGASGEVWMIDAIRVWAFPNPQVHKVTLFGALDNPPVPGVPVCDCHALVPISSEAVLTPENGLWRFEFRNVRWSVPGDLDVLFTLRSTPAEPGWNLSAFPAPKSRLHLLNEKGVPIGLEPLRLQPVSIPIQVWAHRTSSK